MLPLNIDRKPYMGSPMALPHLTLSDLETSKSRSLTLQSLISHKGVKLGHMLLLTINRKPYMESPMTPQHLTLKGQSQGQILKAYLATCAKEHSYHLLLL